MPTNPDPETFFRQARKAATAVVTDKGYIIGIARENVRGYTPAPVWRTRHFASYDAAQAEADSINREVFNLDPKDAYAIVASSLHGM